MRSLLVPVLFVLSVCGAFGAPELTFPADVTALSDWFSAQGNRREGSMAEARVFGALDQWFSGRTEVHRADFRGLDEEHSFSQRLWFRVAGTLPGELVIVVPTDGANHRGLAWAVAWAQDVLTVGTPISLTFLFTGAERGEGTTSSLGSRTFLQDFYPTGPAGALYLDADASSSTVRFTTESGIFPSPLWMVQGLTEAFGTQHLSAGLTGSAPALFRLDLAERRNLLAPWFERSIPALWVSSGPASRAVVRGLETFVSSLEAGVPAHWDRHYLAFEAGTAKVFWDQRTYLVVFLSVSALLLFGYAALGRRRGSLKVLGPAFWQVPALLAVLFLALGAGSAVTAWLSRWQGNPELWKQAPLAIGALKGLVAVSLYLFLFLPFRRSPLVRDPDFYGQAALLWLGVLVVVAAAFELSFSFYFLWALVWAAVLVVAPWRWVKLAALTLGPLWLFKAAYDVLGPQPDLALARWALVSPLAGNLVLAVLLLPFLLQINAWHLSGRGRRDRSRGLRAAIQLTLWFVAMVTAGFLVLNLPLNLPRPTRTERIDLPSRTRETFPAARPLPFVHGIWTTAQSRSAFLDRTVWDLTFRGSTAPETLELVLESDGPLTIYECSFPVILDPEGTRARIVVGRQPPLPLGLHLTLPARTRARLEVKAVVGQAPVRTLTDAVELGP